uniref:Uncharacterized protein n=1 Tax=Arundo donax TaxID=35708 RepID=A0A0A9FWC4_ARUDO
MAILGTNSRKIYRL